MGFSKDLGVRKSKYDKVLIFADGDSKNIPVTVTTHASNVEGTIHLDASEGWNIEDSTQKFEILKKGDSQTFYFRVTPPSDENQGKLIPEVTVAGKTVSKELVTIDYSHVPKLQGQEDPR